MKFQEYKLGYQPAGTIVEVTLRGSAANVRLMDSSNLNNYRSGRRHQYWGGLIKRSPARLTIPRASTWYVTVDLQGLRGHARSSIKVIPRESVMPLPEYSAPPLAPLVRPATTIAEGVSNQHSPQSLKLYDVFICHATEDKDEIARPLASALRAEDLQVWYDEFELRIGDNLRRKIDAGLANSRFGVVVISHSFFAKNWPQYELDGLVTREMTGEQVILPLWHNISMSEVVEISPSLANKVARRTSDFTIEQIAHEITSVIRDSLPD